MRIFILISFIIFSCKKEETKSTPRSISFEPYASMGMDQDPIPFHPSDAISFGCSFDEYHDGRIKISYIINDEEAQILLFASPSISSDTSVSGMVSFLKSFKVDAEHGDMVRVNVVKTSELGILNEGSIVFRADSSMQKTISWEIDFPLGDNGSWNYYLDWENFVVYDDYTKIPNSMDINMVVDSRSWSKFRLWNPSTADSAWESHGANSAHPLKREYMFNFPQEECTNGKFLSLVDNTGFSRYLEHTKPEHLYTYMPLVKPEFIESYEDGSINEYGVQHFTNPIWKKNVYQEIGEESKAPTVLMFRQSENAGVETIKLIVKRPV